MSAHIHALPIAFGPAYIRTAIIIQPAARQAYRVRLASPGPNREMTAQLATAPPRPLAAGDTVLVAGEHSGRGYIIGILPCESNAAIVTDQGAGARIHGQGEDQSITVHDRHGQTLFEYYPGSGRSVVKSPKGDLELEAPDGAIRLRAGGDIQCCSATEVSLSGTSGVHLSADGQGRLPDQQLHLDREGVRLGVDRMDVSAGMGRISMARAVYRGQQVDGSVDRARMVYGRLEMVVERLLQRSGTVIRQIRHLLQTRAGRIRTLVDGAHHIQSKRTTLIAETDVRIDGKKINLG